MEDHEELPRQEVRDPSLEGCRQILGDSSSCSSNFPMRARMAKQGPKAACSKSQLGRQDMAGNCPCSDCLVATTASHRGPSMHLQQQLVFGPWREQGRCPA